MTQSPETDGRLEMNIVDVVMMVESGTFPDDVTEQDIIDAIGEHKESLRVLQGSWGRLIANMEEEGTI